MALPNDVTVLRFYKDDTPAPQLAIAHLSGLENALISLACIIPNIWMIQLPGGQLKIAAPARQGCLELFLVPDLFVPDPEHLVSLATDGAAAIVDLAEKYGGIAAVLWQLAFGDRGALDLWTKATQRAAEVPTAPTPEIAAIYRLSSVAVKDEGVRHGMRQLTEAARACGMDRVTIEVTDGPELPLYESTHRRRKGLIAARSRNPAPAHDVGALQTVEITPTGEPPIRVVYNGQEAEAFVAHESGSGARRLIVWRSKHPRPPVNPVEVRGVYLDPLAIEPLDEVPEFLEEVEGVFLVNGVILVE